MSYQNFYDESCPSFLIRSPWLPSSQDITNTPLLVTPQDDISLSPMNIPNTQDQFLADMLGEYSELGPEVNEENDANAQRYDINDVSLDPFFLPDAPDIIIAGPDDLGGQLETGSQVDFALDMSPAYTEASTVSRASISPEHSQYSQCHNDVIMTASSTPLQSSQLLSPSSRARQPRSRVGRNRPRPTAPFKTQPVITAIRHNFEATFGAHIDAGLKFITLDRFMTAMEKWTYPRPMAGRLRREVVQKAVEEELGLIPTTEGAVWLELLRVKAKKWALSKRVGERYDRSCSSDDSPLAA